MTIAGAVPEAATWAMFVLGLAGVGAAGSRARRKVELAWCPGQPPPRERGGATKVPAPVVL